MTARSPAGTAVNGTVQRRLIALVQILGLAVWFSASAVVPALRNEWGIGTTEAV